MIDEHFQIGEVADRVGLSLRTIRYYEEKGLVMPSGRSEGGFRLYTDSDVERLRLVKALKPLGMTLETVCELLDALDAVDHLATSHAGANPEARSRLETALALAQGRCDRLDEQLGEARAALTRLSRLSAGAAR